MRPRNNQSFFFRHLDSVDGDRAAAGASQRARMLEAMVRAVAAEGYVSVTVADVVAAAGVSRRAFYEHFSDKEACFLEACTTGAQIVRDDIADAVRISGANGWEDRVRVGIETYLQTLSAEPDFAHCLLIDAVGAGPAAVRLRREVLHSFADLYRGGRDENAALGAVPELFRRGLVGGIDFLLQEHIVDHGASSLTEMAPSLVGFAGAVIGAGARTSAGSA